MGREGDGSKIEFGTAKRVRLLRLLHEFDFDLEQNFEGKASNLVMSCGKSALKSRYTSLSQLLKPLTIFATDLWGAFREGSSYDFIAVNNYCSCYNFVVVDDCSSKDNNSMQLIVHRMKKLPSKMFMPIIDNKSFEISLAYETVTLQIITKF